MGRSVRHQPSSQSVAQRHDEQDEGDEPSLVDDAGEHHDCQRDAGDEKEVWDVEQGTADRRGLLVAAHHGWPTARPTRS